MKNLLAIFALFLSLFSAALAEPSGWGNVEKVFGKKGMVMGEVFKITFPRSDLKVKVGEVSVDPGLALISWIGFQQMHEKAMIMGDLVLLDREVAPVMSKLLSEGIEVTALHNHLIGESPSVMYIHFSANGKAIDLANKMKSAITLTGTPLLAPCEKTSTNIDWKEVESILGRKGKAKGNLLQVSVARTETITESNLTIAPSMGISHAINFQMIGKNNAATTGDFVLLASEVNPVAEALIRHGIAVTAVHNHMLFESPRLFMLHFWGVDAPKKLARGLRAALDEVKSVYTFARPGTRPIYESHLAIAFFEKRSPEP